MSESIKLLVIDDNLDDRYLYRRSLQSESQNQFHIIESEDGEDGLAKVAVDRPDCVLLDYSLPGRDGIEVLKRIRSLHPFVAVVMLTGQGNESLAVRAIREGAQNYISKATITPETLRRSVRLAIEHCEMEKRIYEQRAALETFTRALAHDLKEPVRTIRSFLELMDRSPLSESKTKEYYTYIHQAADRMSILIDSVYMLLQTDVDRTNAIMAVCDGNLALIAAKENLSALIAERQAVITNDELPFVCIEQSYLTRLIQNLLCNAIQHMEGQPKIHVTAKQKEKGTWLFSITDNGPGIPKEYQERVFEPFKRLSGDRESNMGLGLTICKKIVDSHGGKLYCESTPPRGATFSFSLSAPDTYKPAPRAEHEAVDAKVNMLAHEHGATLLLVEDNDADIELVRFALFEEHKVHCRLLVAHTGEEAIARLRSEGEQKEAIDLILLDINMPGLDGFETLKSMRDNHLCDETPVVMCTTSSYEKDKREADRLGASGYLVKPLVFSDLKAVVRALPNLQFVEGTDSTYAIVWTRRENRGACD